MSHHRSLDALLADIGERSGLPLELDSRGSCGIEYGGGFEIIITSCDRGEGVLLHSPIQFLDRIDPLSQLRRCLELSLYGAQTGGAALGLDPDGEAIVLWRRLRIADFDSRALEQAIIAFASTADTVRARLSHATDDDGDEDDYVDDDEQPFAHAGNAGFIRI
jgi:Tir chaperone protein (CesT) family